MVVIEFQPEEPFQIHIRSETKDNLDQVLIYGGFALGMLLVIIILLIRTGSAPFYFYIWLGFFLLGMGYFIFPTFKICFEISNDKWFRSKLFYYIPYKTLSGRISEIDELKIIEIIEHQENKSKLNLRKTIYYSALEIWNYKENENQEKKRLITRKTNDHDTHANEMDKITTIALKIKKIFTNLAIPFDIDYDRNIVH